MGPSNLDYLPKVFGILAFLLFGVSGAYAVGNLEIVSNGARADGTVVGVSHYYMGRLVPGYANVTLHYPVVEFRTEAGEYIKFVGNTGIPSNSHQPTQWVAGRHEHPVPVLYLPGKPKDARIDKFDDLWTTPLIMLGAGLPCVFLAIVFSIARVRRRERAETARQDWLDRNSVA